MDLLVKSRTQVRDPTVMPMHISIEPLEGFFVLGEVPLQMGGFLSSFC